MLLAIRVDEQVDIIRDNDGLVSPAILFDKNEIHDNIKFVRIRITTMYFLA